MKLYTEEQVREITMDIIRSWSDEDVSYINNFLNQYTPIELPSDEEVEKETDSVGFTYDVLSFFYGAKWVIEQIKQQDNG